MVHLTEEGYRRLAIGIVSGIKKAASLQKSRCTVIRFSGTGSVWHGFTSWIGSRQLGLESGWKPAHHTWRGRRGGALDRDRSKGMGM